MDKQKAVRKEKEGAFVDLLNQEMRELQDSMKQKQIEEMAKALKEEKLYALINKTSYMRSAENLINAGYRKIPENAVVLSKEEYQVLKIKEKEKHWLETCMSVWKNAKIDERKETAEKFAERLKETLNDYRLDNEYFIKNEPNGNLWQMNSSIFYLEVLEDGGLIDEIAKEIIGERE